MEEKVKPVGSLSAEVLGSSQGLGKSEGKVKISQLL
jgi:hypothetical protein